MEPKPKSDNWVEKNYILVGDSHIDCAHWWQHEWM